ncbi:MAG: hypothetical protein CMH24_03890 [Nitrosomonadales bacterium]|nr:hypothetical protein [Nitrosomonadales bacterium]|tara:strand:- start:919 stop:1242 length:324 start_codon:yes stop_codon:yes gene_type:complete
MPRSPYIIALSTFANKRQAQKISKKLVQEGLVACVNIVDNIHSIYRWKTKIVSEKEVLVIIKTIKSNKQRLKKFILNNHSYDNPELVFISIDDGLKNYLEWIEKEVK